MAREESGKEGDEVQGAISDDDPEDIPATELTLFQCKEMYVYKIPPRMSSLSYRADEWNINKWEWEGSLRVVSKGDECTIRLEDSKTGELFALAPVRQGQPLPVEAVIDSSRFFALRIEDTSSGHGRHAFIGIGFRERPQAYDFQAALHDHLKYLNRKKEAEEAAVEYEQKPSQDMSLKPGETLRLDIPKVALGQRKGSFLKGQTLDEDFAKGLLLRPPPRAAELVRRPSNVGDAETEDSKGGKSVDPAPAPSESTTSSNRQKMRLSSSHDDENDDFGDFQGAG